MRLQRDAEAQVAERRRPGGRARRGSPRAGRPSGRRCGTGRGGRRRTRGRTGRRARRPPRRGGRGPWRARRRRPRRPSGATVAPGSATVGRFRGTGPAASAGPRTPPAARGRAPGRWRPGSRNWTPSQPCAPGEFEGGLGSEPPVGDRVVIESDPDGHQAPPSDPGVRERTGPAAGRPRRGGASRPPNHHRRAPPRPQGRLRGGRLRPVAPCKIMSGSPSGIEAGTELRTGPAASEKRAAGGLTDQRFGRMVTTTPGTWRRSDSQVVSPIFRRSKVASINQS